MNTKYDKHKEAILRQTITRLFNTTYSKKNLNQLDKRGILHRRRETRMTPSFPHEPTPVSVFHSAEKGPHPARARDENPHTKC